MVDIVYEGDKRVGGGCKLHDSWRCGHVEILLEGGSIIKIMKERKNKKGKGDGEREEEGG